LETGEGEQARVFRLGAGLNPNRGQTVDVLRVTCGRLGGVTHATNEDLPMPAFDQQAADTIAHMVKNLRNLDRWLERATEHATTRKFEVDVLLSSRLAPDAFALVRQIQSVCDTAKLTGARLASIEAPVHPDTETTVTQLRERIANVAGWLEGLGTAAFAGAGDRKISTGWMRGKAMTAPDYLFQFALPNFFFHLVTAYSILRHNGVELGKMDYIGGATLVDP
jgi:hypothetical protein